MPTQLTIFVSHANNGDNATLLEFITKLKLAGFHVVSDLENFDPVEGLPLWMGHNIKNSDYVLVICSKDYYDKLESDSNIIGLGVKFEYPLIVQRIYNNGSKNNVVIPVILRNEDSQYIPFELTPHLYYNVNSNDGFDKLCRKMHGFKEQIIISKTLLHTDAHEESAIVVNNEPKIIQMPVDVHRKSAVNHDNVPTTDSGILSAANEALRLVVPAMEELDYASITLISEKAEQAIQAYNRAFENIGFDSSVILSQIQPQISIAEELTSALQIVSSPNIAGAYKVSQMMVDCLKNVSNF